MSPRPVAAAVWAAALLVWAPAGVLAGEPAGREAVPRDSAAGHVLAAGRFPAPEWLVTGNRDEVVPPGQVAFSWHGTAAVEVRSGSASILIDPFYSRPSMWDLAAGPVAPDAVLLKRYVRRPDAVFVSHAHYDHFLDAPSIARRFGVPLYLPADGVRIATLAGVAPADIRVVGGGERIAVGDLEVEVVRARHPEVVTQLLAGGIMPDVAALPIRYSDYKTDEALVFLIRHGNTTIAHLDAPDALASRLVERPVDVALVSVGVWYRRPQIFARVGRALAPAVIVPIHHDDFLQPLSGGLVENPFAHWRDALAEIERDATGSAVVGFGGFFDEFRVVPGRPGRLRGRWQD